MDSSETVRAAFEDLLQSQFQPTIAVKRVRNLTRIIYVSAIAHPLAIQTQLPVAIVAAELAPLLRLRLPQPGFSFGLPLSLAAQATLRIQASQSGLIEIEFTDRTIALWLKSLLAAPPLPQLSSQPQIPSSKLQPKAVFAAQYSHARCCSLLRLAHAQNQITRLTPECESIAAPIAAPIDSLLVASIDSPIAGQLQLDQPARCLLTSLFGLWAALFQPIDRPNPLLEMSSQSFQQFHRDVQLFAVKPDQDPDRTHWLLLLAIQRVTSQLLEKLQLPIPTEL